MVTWLAFTCRWRPRRAHTSSELVRELSSGAFLWLRVFVGLAGLGSWGAPGPVVWVGSAGCWLRSETTNPVLSVDEVVALGCTSSL